MLFSFLKYLQPTHYFQKFNKNGVSIFPIVDFLPEDVKKKLQKDTGYISQIAIDYDMAWQAIINGYIGSCERYTEFKLLPITDNYRFIRKNFHQFWVFYVLIIRILSFHNPLKEIKGWYVTRKVKKVKITNPINYPNWDSFSGSKLTKLQPKVSVIIPTLNRYDVLKDVLHDLEQQEYKNFEVIVVDQSDDFNSAFYKDFDLNFNIIRQEEKALWLARNEAIKNSKGGLIALSEDDVRIQPDWISLHIKCLDFFKAKVSAGVFYPKGKQIPFERSFFTRASQFATGNAMLYKKVFEEVNLFDRQFEKQRMGDGEFGMRLYLSDIMSVSNPYACCIDVKAPKGGLREMGSWDAFRPSNFFAPRPIPSVIYFFRSYFGNASTKLALLRTVPLSLVSYKYKKSKLLLILSFGLAFILSPIILFQVFKSWTLATKKIKEGPKIGKL